MLTFLCWQPIGARQFWERYCSDAANPGTKSTDLCNYIHKIFQHLLQVSCLLYWIVCGFHFQDIKSEVNLGATQRSLPLDPASVYGNGIMQSKPGLVNAGKLDSFLLEEWKLAVSSIVNGICGIDWLSELISGLNPAVGNLPLKGWPLTVSVMVETHLSFKISLRMSIVCLWLFCSYLEMACYTGYWSNPAEFGCTSSKTSFTWCKSISAFATTTTATAPGTSSSTRQSC